MLEERQELAVVDAPPPTDLRALKIRLTVLSFLMLFVELSLIRWLGAHVLYLSYFSNIVLLGSFLGIGVGFLHASRSMRSLLPFAPLALGVLILGVRILEPKVGITGGTIIFLGLDTSGPPIWLVTPIVFVCVAAVLACLGDGVARTFKELRQLRAYYFDVLGSLLGTVVFAFISAVHGGPVVWAAIIAAGLVWTLRPRNLRSLALVGVPLLAVLVTMVVEIAEDDATWTPYYKVSTEPVGDTEGVVASVNGIPTWYQFKATESAIYQTSYDRITSGQAGNVLIIGAGSGNDVSVALSRDATSIDAVEIDAHLLDLGRGHPDRPYDDSRVRTHVEDGRAFVERSSQKWDTILLALPDSLTLLQGNSSLRLESYLFTKEAVERYRDRLTDTGVFSMYNYYRESWLVDRYAGTLEEVFGTAPCLDTTDTLSILTIGRTADAVTCPPGQQWVRPPSTPAPATDNAPFPYLRERTIPSFYLVAIALILIVSLLSVRWLGGPLRGMASYTDLFLLGSAFLLLETKNVVQFALLFGTTWLVNALVFAGVLVTVLLAIVVTGRTRIRPSPALYGLLVAALALAWIVPGSALLQLDFVPRLIAGTALAFLPLFIANLIFSSRFRDTSDSSVAFGANLLGAMVGGLLEYTSLVIGFRHLLIVVLVLYVLAFASSRRWGARPVSA